MATLEVKVDDGLGGWTTIEADRATITRRMAVAQATFRVPDAAIADRIALPQGKEVRISITEGTDVVRFAGYIEKSKVTVRAPRHFDLEVTCVGLE